MKNCSNYEMNTVHVATRMAIDFINKTDFERRRHKPGIDLNPVITNREEPIYIPNPSAGPLLEKFSKAK